MHEDILAGAYDLHVHTGPDVLPRKLDDLEMADRLIRLGMKGHGIKNHYFCTAERARLINAFRPGYRAVGGLCLNNTVGGLNPVAVEMAARDGAKIIWMPTFDSANEQEHIRHSPPDKLPHWAQLRMEYERRGKPLPVIGILEDGRLKKAASEVLEIIASHRLILATGHLGKEEVLVLVKEAVRHGVRKIVVTHPNFPSLRLSKEEQKELAELGAFMEHCYTTPNTGKDTWESVCEQIRYVGPDRCILSTDLGQPAGPYPDEGLADFVGKLLEGGFRREEIRRMTAENTSHLVES